MVYAIIYIYTDDIQIYASCPSTQDAVDSLMVRLEACLSDIKDWMRKHFLKLNDSKSEFALFGSSQQRRKVVIPNLMVGAIVMAPVDQVRSLGLLLDLMPQWQWNHRLPTVSSHLFTICATFIKSRGTLILKLSRVWFMRSSLPA